MNEKSRRKISLNACFASRRKSLDFFGKQGRYWVI